jgi:arylsulfatase A-like enzyme
MALRTENRPRASRLPFGLLAVLTVASAVAIAPEGRAAAAVGDPPQLPLPNVVLIMTDDQPASTATPAAMPNLHRLLIGQGTSFSNYVVTTPLCCPSRATTITGQYGHNNGVLRNDYADLIGKRNVLPAWLQRAGYNTAHVGKFLNGFGSFLASQKEVAPGWDFWFTQFENKAYYDWKASKNGRSVSFGDDDSDHLTEVTNRRAANWTRKLVKKPDPFYLQVDYYAPHGAPGRDRRCLFGPVPAPQDEGVFDQQPLAQPPNFNEADVSDKPALIAGKPLLGPAAVEQITRRYRCTLESLLGVDRGIAKIYNAVARRGELGRTVFIFTSDNGYYLGEHRIDRGKLEPYDENLRMPLTMLLPPAYRDGAPLVADVDDLSANIDLAPTILDLAGAAPCRRASKCRRLDGRSLRPLLSGSGDDFAGREMMIELNTCQYRGVRTQREMYLEYGTGPLPTNGRCKPTAVEHYDIADDPYQLENIYPAPRRSPDGRLELELQRRMAELADCSGIAGRDPVPESGTYCG